MERSAFRPATFLVALAMIVQAAPSRSEEDPGAARLRTLGFGVMARGAADPLVDLVAANPDEAHPSWMRIPVAWSEVEREREEEGSVWFRGRAYVGEEGVGRLRFAIRPRASAGVDEAPKRA